MIIVAALGTNRVIGRGDGLPWNDPEEYHHYLRLISGQVVIMGRRSYRIFGNDLTSEYNVVVSRSVKTFPRAVSAATLEEALELATTFGPTVFCAGGATVYRDALPYTEAMYLSYMKGEFDGDAFFPEFPVSEWIEESRVDHPGFEFVTLRRKTAATPKT